MNSKLFIAASLALAAVHGAALADTSSYAERMRLIGRTAQAGEQAPAQFVDSSSGQLRTAAQQRADHVARMNLIGRTAAHGETSATAVSDTFAGNAQQQFEQRMKLIGRTVSQSELAGYNVETNNQLSAQRATRSAQ
jgi:hypothetical protein